MRGDDAGRMTTDRLGIEILETNTCLEMLRSAEVGRLAVSITNHPDIFPVNFVVDHGTVVFRTAEGTKLAAAVLGRSVAFEADGYDPDAGDAWSVVIKGGAVEIERMQDVFDALDLPLFPWHSAPKHRFVRIEPHDISGRRFHVVDEQAWGGPRRNVPRAHEE
jgi:nitroimidazol reductase NimA-like FMN-containing flavoprotein (pyridoxamine 5'-phosphate oxidase superfamily)